MMSEINAEIQGSSGTNLIRMESEFFSHEGGLEWSIKNSEELQNSSITSNEFSISPCCKIKWQVQVQVTSFDSATLRVFVERKDRVEKPVSTNFQCSFKNSEGEVYQRYSLETIFLPYSRKSGKMLLLRKPDSNVPQEPWDLEDVLIVQCEINMKQCCVVTKTVEKHEFPIDLTGQSSSSDITRGYRMLYVEKPFSDVEFKVRDQSIRAHKAILSCRSPVFRCMFESDMIENRNGVIEIEDTEPAVVEAFLSFLYTGSVSIACANVVRELYIMADKYQVDTLHSMCRSMMMEYLNSKTVCDALKLADLHNDNELKEAASMFISDNFPVLKNSAEFKSLVETHSYLLVHILMANHYSRNQQLVEPLQVAVPTNMTSLHHLSRYPQELLRAAPQHFPPVVEQRPIVNSHIHHAINIPSIPGPFSPPNQRYSPYH